MCGNLASPARGVVSSNQALLKLVEDCGLQSLVTICEYLKDGVENPAVRGMVEEVLGASVRQFSLILKQIGVALEGMNDG